MAQNLNKIN